MPVYCYDEQPWMIKYVSALNFFVVLLWLKKRTIKNQYLGDNHVKAKN